jgi:hypothetical protein
MIICGGGRTVSCMGEDHRDDSLVSMCFYLEKGCLTIIMRYQSQGNINIVIQSFANSNSGYQCDLFLELFEQC